MARKRIDMTEEALAEMERKQDGAAFRRLEENGIKIETIALLANVSPQYVREAIHHNQRNGQRMTG